MGRNRAWSRLPLKDLRQCGNCGGLGRWTSSNVGSEKSMQELKEKDYIRAEDILPKQVYQEVPEEVKEFIAKEGRRRRQQNKRSRKKADNDAYTSADESEDSVWD